MRALIVSITALLGSTVILMTGSGLLGTLLSVRMGIEQYSPGITGLVMSAYFAGLMLGALGAGAVIRRAGHIRAFAVFAALVTAATLVHALWIDPWVWGALRVISGFSLAGLYMVIESWLNERGAGGARGRLFSLYQATSYLGLGLGQLLISVRPASGPELFMLNAVLLALCLVPVSLTRAIHPTPPERTPMALALVCRGSPLGVFICLGAGIVNGSAFALAPLFIVDHVGLQSVAVFMSAVILGGMLLQYPIGHLSDVFDRRRLLVAVNLALAAFAVVMLFVANSGLTVLAAVGLGYGGLTFTLYPLAVAHINDRVRSDNFVGVAGALLFLWGIGAVVGPIAIGQLMNLLGTEGLFHAAAACAVLMAAATLAARREQVPNEEQTAFVSMARTTTVITEMDPRADPGEQVQMDWIEEMQTSQETEAAAP
ncbi:putative MFS-type transporter YcaD [wastewater metagenome]|uniref:Putative MFS-type transporter YcaD n=2 Tax=unclassified sequences TaxID=12908 RepID=A0A5B8RBZ7_9ZZZZ|nr:MFS transporter [Arhodomonas sp. KWT]QEA04994.1 putative MFS-type transporter YcaD [uncultured organism]